MFLSADWNWPKNECQKANIFSIGNYLLVGSVSVLRLTSRQWNHHIFVAGLGVLRASLGCKVHMLIVGLDYSCDRISWAGKNVLDTKYAVDMMATWCHQSCCSGTEVATMCTFNGCIGRICSAESEHMTWLSTWNATSGSCENRALRKTWQGLAPWQNLESSHIISYLFELLQSVVTCCELFQGSHMYSAADGLFTSFDPWHRHVIMSTFATSACGTQVKWHLWRNCGMRNARRKMSSLRSRRRWSEELELQIFVKETKETCLRFLV